MMQVIDICTNSMLSKVLQPLTLSPFLGNSPLTFVNRKNINITDMLKFHTQRTACFCKSSIVNYRIRDNLRAQTIPLPNRYPPGDAELSFDSTPRCRNS